MEEKVKETGSKKKNRPYVVLSIFAVLFSLSFFATRVGRFASRCGFFRGRRDEGKPSECPMHQNFDVGEQVKHLLLVLRLLFERFEGEFNLFGVIVEGDDAFFSVCRLDSLDNRDYLRFFLLFRHKLSIL